MLLHDGGGDADDLLPLGQALARSFGAGLALLAPQAPSGRFDGRAVLGHDWFRRDGDLIEPASFGVSLALLESFVIEQGSGPTVLLGQGDGACLALALLALAPDLAAGVASLEGQLPDLRGWGLAPGPIGGRPVLLIGRREAAAGLAALGAVVSAAESAAVSNGALARWLIRTLDSGSAGAG